MPAWEDIFDMSGAADYVGLKLDAFKQHVYKYKTVELHQVGNHVLFERGELDRFMAAKRPVGRPSKEPSAK